MARIVNIDPLGIWTGLHRLDWTARERRTLEAARRILDKAGDQLPEPWAFECKCGDSALDELGVVLR